MISDDLMSTFGQVHAGGVAASSIGGDSSGSEDDEVAGASSGPCKRRRRSEEGGEKQHCSQVGFGHLGVLLSLIMTIAEKIRKKSVLVLQLRHHRP